MQSVNPLKGGGLFLDSLILIPKNHIEPEFRNKTFSFNHFGILRVEVRFI